MTLQRRQLESIHEWAIGQITELTGAPPNLSSLQPFPHSGPVLAKIGAEWRLNETLRTAFAEARESAQSNLAPVYRRSFGDRLRERARSEAAQTAIETMSRIVVCVAAELLRLESEPAAQSVGRRDEARALRNQAEQRLSDLLNVQAGALASLPAPLLPWANEAWADWSPVNTAGELFAGSLRPKVDTALAENQDFGCDVVLPLYLQPAAGLHLAAHKANRQAMHALARSLLVRSLASHAPGSLRLTVFDPVGLGQSVAPLLELAEYDQELLGGKIWSGPDDFKTKMAELTAHIELVVQKYLRADYATLAEFNAAAGEVATPYRLLVVFDFPAHFDQTAFSELRRIIEIGPRCGVGTLLVTNSDEPIPHGVELASLPKSMTRINVGFPFSFAGAGDYELVCDLQPDSDHSIPNALLDDIVETIGGQARSRVNQSVGFETVFGLFSAAALEGRKRGLPHLTNPISADDAETWWSETTVDSIAAPIGMRGARDVAVLQFDSSDHSGALLVGRPGSGKSTLLHTFIAGITTMYGPSELELHLIDFKEGVEFQVYGANSLPHARTVAIESDREFGVNVLEAIQSELRWRGSLLRGSTESHSSLQALRKATGERLPRVVLIFDEFQVLFARNDKLGAVAAEALEMLIRQGRGFGIHVLLGSQSLSGLDALGSHVPQLLPVRILLPSSDSDAAKVLGEGNKEGSSLTTAGEGILNMAGGAVQANERFRGAMVAEDSRRERVAAMRAKADESGFNRRPVVFEGNSPIAAEDTPPEQFVDEIRGADRGVLRLRFGAPMAIMGSADINLRREAGANVLLVARDSPIAIGPDAFSLPKAVTANVVASAVARDALVVVADFLPEDEGLGSVATPLVAASAVGLIRRRQVPEVLNRLRSEVSRRVESDDTSGRETLLVLYGMHRARDFDQESVDYDADTDLSALLGEIVRDGPEVGIHTFMWFETLSGINRRLAPGAMREVAWRLAGKMSPDDSSSFLGVETASSLREQQLIAANEDRGVLQRCTTIAAPPEAWLREMLLRIPTTKAGE